MASKLPDYVASAQPVPPGARAAWYKNTAQTYAGIMLWFVFWFQVPLGEELVKDAGWSRFAGGTLAQGLGMAFVGLILAALLCHFLFYVVPGMLGMKTGLPLYIVGTSTYGVQGGFLMPGFLMGVLQFGWLAVNAYFAGLLLCLPFKDQLGSALPVVQGIVSAAWAILGVRLLCDGTPAAKPSTATRRVLDAHSSVSLGRDDGLISCRRASQASGGASRARPGIQRIERPKATAYSGSPERNGSRDLAGWIHAGKTRAGKTRPCALTRPAVRGGP